MNVKKHTKWVEWNDTIMHPKKKKKQGEVLYKNENNHELGEETEFYSAIRVKKTLQMNMIGYLKDLPSFPRRITRRILLFSLTRKS